MQLKSIKPGIYNIQLHSLELATLISAARWAAEGAKGKLTPEAVQQLQQVIRNYDIAVEVLQHQKQKEVKNNIL